MNKSIIKRKTYINPAITGQLIELQSKGYDRDFAIDDEGSLICLQDQERYQPDTLFLVIVAEALDHRDGHPKYIFAVETGAGEKGILLTNSLKFIKGCE